MICCPKCAYKFDYREAVMDEDWQSIITLLPVFGTHGKLVFEYVEKFGINPLRIKGSKVLRLLRQIARLFEKGSFEWRKSNKTLSKSGIVEALDIVVNKHFDTPLENHNYLKKVMVGISEREGKEKSKREEKQLREKEASCINRSLLTEEEKGETISAEEFRRRKKELTGQIERLKGMD